MKKQLIFGLMAGTMALSLTACGGGNSETTAAASNDTQATADSTAAAADSTAAAADSTQPQLIAQQLLPTGKVQRSQLP